MRTTQTAETAARQSLRQPLKCAVATAFVVEQAERVRGLSRSEAVRFVADRTGATAAEVERFLALGLAVR